MISIPPIKETDLTSQSWLKWFSTIFDSFKNIDTNGDVLIDSSSRGLVLKDSAGVYWRFTVSTSGVVTSTNLGTTKPQGI